VACLAFSVTPAQALLVGDPATGGNCFPFGCGSSTSTRYQQIYSSNEFSGPISISEIRFFGDDDPGSLNTGTYILSLSTTNIAVNALSTTDFDSNLGIDNQFFTSKLLKGEPVPQILSFLGTPYNYNPASGNLLLDIQSTITDSGLGFLNARNGNAGGIFSRAHNFGSGFENFGLVTEFISTQVPEPASLALLGIGLAGLGFTRRRRRA
jgi:hypothetical protein